MEKDVEAMGSTAENAPRHHPPSRKMVRLRPDLDLHIADFSPQETLRMQFEANQPGLNFTFLREGKGYMDWRVSRGTAVTRKVLPIECSSSLSFFPELSGDICFPGGHRQSHLSIRISPSLLATFMGGRFGGIPHDLQAILHGSKRIDFHHRGPLSPAIDALIGQFLDCPYSGPLGMIYREAKAIELMAHKLAQIEPPLEQGPASTGMRADDIERVHYARDILIGNLENPPRLFDLARAAGTSHTQLNRGFKKMYGVSVFGYLRKLRIEEARQLLEKGSMNVTEVALAVGYNSLSSFCRAFSAHFGATPLSFLKTKHLAESASERA